MGRNELTDTTPDARAISPDLAPPPAQFAVDVGGRTHAGRVKPLNQDNYHVVQFGRHLRTVLSSLPADHAPEETDRVGYALAVADGLGGRPAGEVASRRAIELLVQFALLTPDWILGPNDALLAKMMDRAVGRFRGVHEAVRAEGRTLPGMRGMATTLSVAMSLGEDLIIAHVGNSPVCLFRGGRLHRLTRDHAFGKERAEPNAATGDRIRRVLTRAVGSATGGQPDVARYRLADGDRVLVCTDGLTDAVNDEAIARELGRPTSSDEACRALLDLALDAGGKDNITVVVASYWLDTQR